MPRGHAHPAAYTYDSAGNRSQLWATRGTIDYTYDANNRLTKAGNRSYTYDDNGNQLTETTPDETVTMAYTEDNRLKNYQRQNSISDGDDDETAHQVSYTYDPLGRRSSKSQRGHEGVRTQEYQYDGMGLDLIRIADAASLVTTAVDATDATLLKKDTVEDSRAKFIKPQRHEQYETNGLDVLYANGRIFSSLSRDKGLTIYTTDYLGSVRYTSNNHDASKHSYNYDAFGESVGAAPDLFGYNGRVYDRVTTNHDYGFRDYAPKQGRFTTVDPIQDGNNWYAYVNNDPVNSTDPNGLEKREFTATSVSTMLIPLESDPVIIARLVNTVTVHVTVDTEKNTAEVWATSTNSAFIDPAVSLDQVSVATVKIHDVEFSSKTLEQEPALVGPTSIDLGAATMELPPPGMADLSVEVATTFTSPSETGLYYAGTQVTTVKICNTK